MILVVGSANTDMVVQTRQFPAPGETVMGGRFFMFPGGKGANQAVAAARLGGRVSFLARIGKDVFGDMSLAGFQAEGIATAFVVRDSDHASGVALITIDQSGQNTIVVAPGANNALSELDISAAAAAFEAADVVLLQQEIPEATVAQALATAFSFGKRVILNPAPARPVPDSFWSQLFLCTPNETEASFYSGIVVENMESAREAAQILHRKGLARALITLGHQGCFFSGEGMEMTVPAYSVKAVDTTAAGDIFNGALALAIQEAADWEAAIRFASRAAAISVTRMGAQSSAPTREEVNGFIF